MKNTGVLRSGLYPASALELDHTVGDFGLNLTGISNNKSVAFAVEFGHQWAVMADLGRARTSLDIR